MALDLQGTAVGHVVIVSRQLQTVVGGDGDFLKGNFLEFRDDSILNSLDFPGLIIIGIVVGPGHGVIVKKCQFVAEV